MLYDAEMPVSSTLWDKIEQRIDTKPDKPKYWMIYLLTAIAIPAMYMSVSVTNVDKNKIIISESANTYTYNSTNSTKGQNRNQLQSINSENINYTLNKKPERNASRITDEILPLSQSKSSFNSQFSEVKNQGTLSHNKSIFKSDDEQIIYDNPIESVLLKFGSIKELSRIELIKSKSIESTLDSGDERPLIQRLFSPANRCPRFSNKLKGLYVWADYTSAYTSQSLSANTTEYDTYINSRNSSETSIYSFSSSLGLGFIHTSGWFVESGLTYDQINTQFHQTEENIIGTEEIIRTSKDENGNVTGTYTEVIPIIGYNEIRHINKLTQMDIPLLVGYELPVSPKLNISLKAGPNFNISSHSSGRVLDIDGNPIYFGDDSGSNLYSDKFGIGYIAGAHVIKNINDRLSLNLGVTYRSYTDRQHATIPVRQSFTKYGLSTGVRYRFL